MAIQNLANAWFHTTACENLTRLLESPHPAPVQLRGKAGWLSSFRQLRALMARAALNSVRDPAAYALRYASTELDLLVWAVLCAFCEIWTSAI